MSHVHCLCNVCHKLVIALSVCHLQGEAVDTHIYQVDDLLASQTELHPLLVARCLTLAVPSLQRALAHLAQAVSSIQIEEVRSVPAYIMSIIAKHQPGREVRLRSDSGGASLSPADPALC